MVPRRGHGCSISARTDFLRENQLLALGATSVKICALLYNSSYPKYASEVDYLGFEVTHVFWVGYGLDYKGAYRNLPFIRRLQ